MSQLTGQFRDRLPTGMLYVDAYGRFHVSLYTNEQMKKADMEKYTILQNNLNGCFGGAVIASDL